MLFFFALLTVKSISLYTRWQPINVTKNIQHQVPNQHLMFTTAPEASPFSLVTTIKQAFSEAKGRFK